MALATQVLPFPSGLRTCKKCGETKPTLAFARNQRVRSGYCGTCKECVSARRMAHKVAVGPTKQCRSCGATKSIYEFSRNAHAPDDRVNACKPCASAASVAHARKKPKTKEQQWAAMVWFQYRMRPIDYFTLLERQRGMCAICRTPPQPGKRLVVDHNHTTKAIRGLLCNGCNSGLGYFKDNPTACRNASDYLAERK